MKNIPSKEPSPRLLRFSRTIRNLLLSFALQYLAVSANATPTPYTWDVNTLFLFHFDEPAGPSAATNAGSIEGTAYSVNMTTASSSPPVVTTILGAAGFAGF